MRVRFEVAPDDVVRMGQRMQVNISYDEAKQLLSRQSDAIQRSLEDVRDSHLRHLVEGVRSSRNASSKRQVGG